MQPPDSALWNLRQRLVTAEVESLPKDNVQWQGTICLVAEAEAEAMKRWVEDRDWHRNRQGVLGTQSMEKKSLRGRRSTTRTSTWNNGKPKKRRRQDDKRKDKAEWGMSE